jgi:hypothetical protein
MIGLNQRIEAFAQLGQVLQNLIKNNFVFIPSTKILHNKEIDYEELDKLQTELILIFENLSNYNVWFTSENVALSLNAWASSLTLSNLKSWLNQYQITATNHKTIGVVMAGNLPLVGFHDYLSVLITGNKLIGKLSKDDNKLLPILHRILSVLEPGFSEMATFVSNQLTGFDAIVATGSNNTARYFDYYFGKYPHIIRRNRNSVAILTGKETAEDLSGLGNDIFSYFGLGCRNVSKLYVPANYDFDLFFKAAEAFSKVKFHSKYFNNYEYNKAIYLVNSTKHLDNGFVLLKQDYAPASPIGVIYFEYYTDYQILMMQLAGHKNEIQCMLGSAENLIPFGFSQSPQLNDYADGIDTIKFLLEL